MHRYLVIIEKAVGNFGAYSPDLPGCVAVADTREQVVAQMQEAIEIHLEGLKEENLPIPEPQSSAEYVTVAA